MNQRIGRYLVLAVALIVIDWLTKLIFPPVDGVGMHYFLQGEPQYRAAFIPLAFLAFGYGMFREAWGIPARVAVTLVFAAAIANIIDALLDHQVVNIFWWQAYANGEGYWFNLADTYLVSGLVLVILDMLLLRNLRTK